MVKRNSFVMVTTVGVRAIIGGILGIGISLLVSALVGKPVPLAIYLVLALGFMVRLTLAVVEWRNTTYRFLESELVYRSGLLSSSTLQVPWSSVRGVSVETPWLLRVFGRSELRIAHGAGQASDVHFKALSPVAVAELRAEIESTREKGSRDVEFFDDTEEFAGAKISLYALTHSQWYVVFPLFLAATGILSQFLDRDIVQTFIYIWGWLSQLPAEMSIILLVGACLLAILGGFISRSIEMANFRVRQTKDLIETRQGLLSTRIRTISTADITLIDAQQPLFFRAVRRVIVRVSGGSGDGDPQNFLSPQATEDEAATAIRSIFGSYRTGALLARSSLLVLLIFGAFWIALVALLNSLIGTFWSAAVAVFLVIVIVRWAIRSPSTVFLSSDGIVEIRRGIASRRQLVFRTSSILHYESVVSPVGGWFPTNRIKITIADRGTRDISVRALRRAEMNGLLQELSRRDDVGTYRYSRVPYEVASDTSDELSTVD